MSAFLQLRLWLRRARGAEKGTALAAVLLLAALGGWALVPTATHSTSVSAASPVDGGSFAAQGGGAAASSTLPEGGAPGDSGGSDAGSAAAVPALPTGVSAPAGAAAVTSSPTSASCPVGATDEGVDDSTIRIGVATVEIAGQVGNEAFKIRSDQKEIVSAIVDDMNTHGGVKCRKVVVKFYKANPLDQTQQHDTCLQMVQDKIFAAIDGGGFFPTPNRDCLPQNHIPVFVPTSLDPVETTTYSPLVFTWATTSVQALRNVAFGSRELGLFDAGKGFKKLGVLEESCLPSKAYDSLYASLEEAGLAKDKIDKTVLQCGAGASPPSAADITAAVIHHRQVGVNVVLPAIDPIALNTYTQIAQQQGYHPRYAVSDFVSQIGAEGNVNAANFDGAIGFTATRAGSLNTGLPLDPGTQRCSQIATSHGLRGYVNETSDSILGAYCSSLWIFRAAASSGQGLTRAGLAANLARAGTVPLAAAAVDAVFGSPGKTWGGDFIRPVQWHAACTCWKAMTPAFRSPF